MAEPNIVAFLDERLIHGQGQLWYRLARCKYSNRCR